MRSKAPFGGPYSVMNNETRNGVTVAEISGPVVRVRGAGGLFMNEMVLVGEENLVGEVIELQGDEAVLQVYEDTTGLLPGTEVYGQGLPLFVELGPGIVGRFFDGIQRPLSSMYERWGAFVRRGKTGEVLDRDRVWTFIPELGSGDTVHGGVSLGRVPETETVMHRILIPPGVNGRVLEIVPEGAYTVDETLAVIEGEDGRSQELRMMHRWPVRRMRPFAERLPASDLLFTGQRVIDFLFPLAKGGAAAIPGGFGTGKTITQHQLSKWADADVIVYIGCGERGNEMAGILADFPNLVDPRTGRPLVERTIFIANTSDMPVAAREASVYTGITMAEYYRDMGYHVALMADSTSRWAEALREISGRLEEMPAEEGFPAYLASRLAGFYERAGMVITLGGWTGSVSLIGAVSPPGSDFSEPVTQHTKRYVSTYWALDKELAASRYFPAVNYLSSYSGYVDAVASWWKDKAGIEYVSLRRRVLEILKEDAKIAGIVKLIGEDALPNDQKVVYQGARILKENFLQQSAFDPVDTFCPPEKQAVMLQIILRLVDWMKDAVAHRIPDYRILELPVLEDIRRMSSAYEGDDLKPFEELALRLDDQFGKLLNREV